MHTARDQGAMVRHFVKWDDQPHSPAATIEAMGRAYMMACTAPCGPSYVILDRRLRDAPAGAAATPGGPLRAAAAHRAGARDRRARGRSPGEGPAAGDPDRPRIAKPRGLGPAGPPEMLGARVITDLRTGASFPTEHPLHGAPPDLFLTGPNRKTLAEADVVLSLDWPDIADVMRAGAEDATAARQLIHVSIDHHVHNGWSGDHQRFSSADIQLSVEPDAVLQPLITALEARLASSAARVPASAAPSRSPRVSEGLPTLADIGDALCEVKGARELCLARVPLNWPAGSYPFRDPLDYLGYDGGGGVGSGRE